MLEQERKLLDLRKESYKTAKENLETATRLLKQKEKEVEDIKQNIAVM